MRLSTRLTPWFVPLKLISVLYLLFSSPSPNCLAHFLPRISILFYKTTMNAAARYNARFSEAIPRNTTRRKPSASDLEASVERRVAACFRNHRLPPGFPSKDSGLGLEINDSSLLNALDESIVFSTTMASVSTIPTPLDYGDDPFLLPTGNPSGNKQDIPAIQVQSEEAIDNSPVEAVNTKKNVNTLLRVVKKAGASAKKFVHKTKSLTKRREHQLVVDVRDVIEAPMVPQNTPQVIPIISSPVLVAEVEEDRRELVLFGAITSLESLAATLGSPTTLSSFPLSPPAKTSIRPLFEPPAALWKHRPKGYHTNLSRGLRLLLRMVLFLPYVLVVGFLPFLAPSHLSSMTFSPIFGYMPSSTTASDRYNHHIKFLPCHIGLAFGFLSVINWDLLQRAPLVFSGFNALLVATAWWVWRDFDWESSGMATLESQELGSDDRATIYHLYEATVPQDVRQTLHTVISLMSSRRDRNSEDMEHRNPDQYGTITSGESVRIVIQHDD
ncbi:hypothetical protein BDY19DRAFT_589486 [Irpex rosettiformis]|uniref:Uncharacterized protein n=1 Tax=Irpex rosettiformis TaxID=378272 RepID=A0ACB8UD89_9APHY|nr:hypothetical protein BDY19DRAFT_589486 [Irpex rosettiformis]